jgi:hypothetical protein
MGDGPRIGEDEARLLWRRAAELQAAAERTQASQALARPGETGLSLSDVAAAADSAGIDADFVRVAHVERLLPEAVEIRPDQRALRWLRPLVGGDADAFEATRFISAPPAQVLEAVRVVFAEPVYALTPELIIGTDPVVDGVLVYRVTKTAEADNFYESMNWADARVLIVLVRAESNGTRVRVRVPLFRRNINLGLAGFLTGLGGYVGGAGGFALGAAAMSPFGIPAALFTATAAIGVAAGAVIGGGAFRRIYWWATNGGRTAINSLLNTVVLRAESQAPSLPPATG